MKRALLLIPVACLVLGACSQLQQQAQLVSDSKTAADKISTAVDTIKSPTATTLTKVQAVSCAAEAAANAATDYWTAKGDTNAAALSSGAAVIAGKGCTWSSAS